MELSSLTIILWLAVNGIFTGICAGIGNYIAQRHIIEKSKKFGEKIRKRMIKKK